MRFVLLALFAYAPPLFAQTHSLDDELIYRINFGSSEDVRVLLEKGANPNTKTTHSESALLVAMERSDAETTEMARLLVEKGADIEEPDKAGNTPIVSAIRYKEPKVVKILLAKGADYRVRTSENMSLIDYAKRFGDAESVQAIQELLDRDGAYEASLRTPERFKDIIHTYALASCSYQYWSYFMNSRQDPSRDVEVGKRVTSIKRALADMVMQIQKYYTSTSMDVLKKISTRAVNGIFREMDAMISNRNRIENGIGREEDARTRCERIVSKLQIDFVPTLRNNIPEPAPATSKAPALPPMPLDPNSAEKSIPVQN